MAKEANYARKIYLKNLNIVATKLCFMKMKMLLDIRTSLLGEQTN